MRQGISARRSEHSNKHFLLKQATLFFEKSAMLGNVDAMAEHLNILKMKEDPALGKYFTIYDNIIKDKIDKS